MEYRTICKNCGRTCEPVAKHTTFEEYYNAEGKGTPLTIYVCPYCGCDELEEE